MGSNEGEFKAEGNSKFTYTVLEDGCTVSNSIFISMYYNELSTSHLITLFWKIYENNEGEQKMASGMSYTKSTDSFQRRLNATKNEHVFSASRWKPVDVKAKEI